ncbi:MAG: hypothetical protein N4J56_007482 [Chroococcidiopsis sp. SAG 2025]|nr:hypothetical protein [Chroococcidiopsis sp. SAG 2025]
MNAIVGYTFGTEQTAHSPLTLNDLELLKQTVCLQTKMRDICEW